MSSLTSLPTELILLIAESTTSQSSLGALALTTRRISSILTPNLISLNIKIHRSSGLTWAITHNDLNLTRLFLDKGADLNTPVIPKEEYEALNEKYKFADPVMVSLRQSGKLETPLYLAVRLNRTGIARLLVDRGAEVRTHGYRGYPSALAKAGRLGNWDVLNVIRGAMGMGRFEMIGGFI